VYSYCTHERLKRIGHNNEVPSAGWRARFLGHLRVPGAVIRSGLSYHVLDGLAIIRCLHSVGLQKIQVGVLDCTSRRVWMLRDEIDTACTTCGVDEVLYTCLPLTKVSNVWSAVIFSWSAGEHVRVCRLNFPTHLTANVSDPGDHRVLGLFWISPEHCILAHGLIETFRVSWLRKSLFSVEESTEVLPGENSGFGDKFIAVLEPEQLV